MSTRIQPFGVVHSRNFSDSNRCNADIHLYAEILDFFENTKLYKTSVGHQRSKTFGRLRWRLVFRAAQ